MPQSPSWGSAAGATQPPDMPAQANSIHVEPSSIPRLVEALQSSLDSVGVQIEHAITELRIQPWAGDPVSTGAAGEFNEHSVGGDDAALTALCGYRDRLQSAAEALHMADMQYQDVEETNVARMRSGC